MPNSFKHIVTLQSPPVGRGGRNQRSGNWVDEKTVRAEIVELQGRELEAANKLYGVVGFRLRIWYDSTVAVNKNWRAKWGDDYLEFSHVTDHQKKKFFYIHCQRVEG